MASAPPRTDIGVDFGWSLSVLARSFVQWATAAVDDLPGEARGYMVLDAVARAQHRSQLALARHVGLDKTAVTYLLDDLEDAKLLKRRPDPEDRRARLITLTAKGERRLQRARDLIGEVEDRLLSVLGPADAEQFRRLLARIAVEAGDPTAPDIVVKSRY